MHNDGSLEMMSYDEFMVKEDCNATLSAKDCHARVRGAGGVGGALVRWLRNLCIGFELVDPRRLLPYLVSAQLRFGAVAYWRWCSYAIAPSKSHPGWTECIDPTTHTSHRHNPYLLLHTYTHIHTPHTRHAHIGPVLFLF